MAQTKNKIMVLPIEGMPDYFIADNGTVYSKKISKRYNPYGDMRIVRARKHPSGYLYIGLYIGAGKNKKRLWRRVHRVVAEAFLNKIPEAMNVDHIDGNRHNNDLSNLRIVTHSENCLAGYQRRNKQKK
jgi:hypothetical protein